VTSRAGLDREPVLHLRTQFLLFLLNHGVKMQELRLLLQQIRSLVLPLKVVVVPHGNDGEDNCHNDYDTTQPSHVYPLVSHIATLGVVPILDH
jgi:hypothetical protein